MALCYLLENHLPGKDAISKSMHKTIEYMEKVREAFRPQ
jgi:hypothetical protein